MGVVLKKDSGYSAMKLMVWVLICGFWIVLGNHCAIATPLLFDMPDTLLDSNSSKQISAATTRLLYTAKDPNGEYRILYQWGRASFRKSAPTQIQVIVSGNLRYEKNQVVLDASDQVLQLLQYTRNTIPEPAHFRWTVDAQKIPAIARFETMDPPAAKEVKFMYPKRGYPVQALLYRLSRLDLTSNTQWSFKFLVPPNQFFDSYIKVLGEESIILNGQSLNSYKVEMGLSGFIGLFADKYTFWVSKSFPHVTYMYKQGGMQVALVEAVN